MDAEAVQKAKNEFALSQNPPLTPCTNPRCKFTGCTCGDKCGCHLDVKELEGLVHCDPCAQFKKSLRAESAAAKE
jgi:hypothetical protein